MKLLTRNTDYAVRAVCYIAKHKDGFVDTDELVAKLKIPRPFLRKILQILNKEEILKSYKGQGGGFELLISPNKIYLLDLIKIFQGPIELNECLFKKKLCPHINDCLLNKKIGALGKHLISKLKNITIESLIKRD